MPKLSYKHYILSLLTTVATFNYIDRYLLSLVLEPIKQEFQLSDSQLGFLTGFGFALFYGVAGIPIARWADRGNRNIIVSVTTGLWSAMLVLCGLVGNFTQLLLVRVGVAIGEAGCLPPGQSLIADYYSRTERTRAMAIYWLCGPLSVIIGFMIGGWLVEFFGWRMTFIVMGVPGILLAILVKFTLREPRANLKTSRVAQPPSFKTVLNALWQRRAFRNITIAFCVSYFFGMGIIQWLPTFFIRSHGMEISEVGTWLAFVWGLCGLFGTFLGGELASRYAAHREALQMRAVAIVFVLGGVLYIFIYLTHNQYTAMALLALAGFSATLTSGVVFSAISSLSDDRMRSVALALVFLMANLIGFGLGPIAAGVLSDLLEPVVGQESLRYTLVLLSPGYLWVAYFYWKASQTIEADIRQVELITEPTETERMSKGSPLRYCKR